MVATIDSSCYSPDRQVFVAKTSEASGNREDRYLNDISTMCCQQMHLPTKLQMPKLLAATATQDE
jgi:hypothetical protein